MIFIKPEVKSYYWAINKLHHGRMTLMSPPLKLPINLSVFIRHVGVRIFRLCH